LVTPPIMNLNRRDAVSTLPEGREGGDGVTEGRREGGREGGREGERELVGSEGHAHGELVVVRVPYHHGSSEDDETKIARNHISRARGPRAAGARGPRRPPARKRVSERNRLPRDSNSNTYPVPLARSV